LKESVLEGYAKAFYALSQSLRALGKEQEALSILEKGLAMGLSPQLQDHDLVCGYINYLER